MEFRGKHSKPKSVLEVLGYDPNRIWYPLDVRIKGYEVSNDGYVRSLKSRKKEYGCMMTPIDGIFTLVDNNGNTVRLTIDQIITMARNNPYKTPRKTEEIDDTGRNKRAFQIKEEDYYKDYMHQPVPTHFTIVDNANDSNSKNTKMKNPIYFIPKERNTNNGN